MRNRRDPNLIRRSTAGDGQPDAASERVAEAERARVQADANIEKAEIAEALSVIARVLGTGEDARMAAVFIIAGIIVIASAVVLIVSADNELRTSIVDLFGKVLLIGIGFLAGHGISRRK
jgi:hypothetical protein